MIVERSSISIGALVELVGGILLIVGFAVPLVGLLVAVDMAGALIFVHAPNGVFVDAGGSSWCSSSGHSEQSSPSLVPAAMPSTG